MLLLLALLFLWVAVVFVLAFMKWLIRGKWTGNFSNRENLEEICRSMRNEH